MKLRSIWTESLRNIGSGTSHAISLALAFLIIATLLGGYGASTVIAMQGEAQERIATLGDTDAIMGGTVDGVTCDQLSKLHHSTIQQSGALSAKADLIEMKATPGSQVQSFTVSPGMIELVASASGKGGDQTVDTSGTWASQSVAEEFGLTTGSIIQTTQGEERIAGIYDWPNDGRDTKLGFALLMPHPASQNDYGECWARQWPHSDRTSELLYSTIADADPQNPSGILPVNRTLSSNYDANNSYLKRDTAFMPVIALAIGCFIGVVAVRSRRLEYAGALHSGQTKASQIAGIGIEVTI
ncbi:hypothetical protein D2E26_0710 [Bifidobacterium dolichotidis]|uniref:Uncharacterized protein n=1 Tax=Bifidobacterium dolichotidis TaxID=2306976 RepID=A0A430FTJ1_9BIFI|nr:hypothetical protein [Bifidobacterium dolichotidis]RSX56147.1 hypothetical protein D2E26_0710 [Bifidobacterium dolichotidis]